MTEPHELDDIPGLDATPEQAAFVSGLLASLRHDDVPMPADVVARLSAVLAEERRSGPAAATATPLADPVEPTPFAVPAMAQVTVLPIRRRGPGPAAFRWVGGIAAAALVVVGGAALLNGTTYSGSSTTAGAASTPPEAVGAADSATRDVSARLADTGTAYTSAALSAQAAALVGTVETRAALGYASSATPSPATGAATPATTEGKGPVRAPDTPGTAFSQMLTVSTVAACVEQLVGAPGTVVIAVDHGTFDGRPADVVVLPSPDQLASYDVWVLVPGCTRTEATPLEFRRIPIP